MTRREFPLAPLQPWAWLPLVAGVLALVVGVVVVAQAQQPPAWLVAPFAVALLFVVMLLALRRRRISVEDGTLVVAATFYTRRLHVDALDLEHARILSLAEHTGFAPVVKLNGYGLPGFRAGHYLLRNRQRAFCLLTRRERVLLLPPRDGKLLLLSPENPRELLDHLRKLATAAARR